MKINQFDPFLGEEEEALILETIKNNWITEGEKTNKLGQLISSYCNVKHAIMFPNGTLSLFVALKIIGIKPGDEVIVPDFTFVGSATSVILAGGIPVFCDVNLDDFSINIESLKKSISKDTKAIMPVHIYGQAADMAPIMELAKAGSIYVIEDAAQGIGVTYKNKHVGTFGNIGCISFYADKTITTGEGGVIMTDDDELAEQCLYFKNQGRLQRGSFVHPKIGYNFRITDLQAAVGIAQMRKLSWIIQKKRENEELYKKHLSGLDSVYFSKDNGFGERVAFRVNILVDEPERLGKFLEENGIGVRRFFYPLHKQPCFNKDNSIVRDELKNADSIFGKGLSLPSGVGLKEEEISFVCQKIKEFFG